MQAIWSSTMTRWIRQLFRSKPTAPIVKQQRARLGLQRLEDRETPANTLSVADAVLVEGNSGTADMVFTITRSGDTSGTLTFGYSTANGSALAGTDYLARSGTLTIPAGAATAEVRVPVIGNLTLEPTKAFTLSLTGPFLGSGAPFGFAPRQTNATRDAPLGIAAADLNADGNPDLLVANRDSDAVSVHVNTTLPGSATMTYSPRLDITTGSEPHSVATGDINGDGKPDVVVGNRTSSTVTVLLNTTPAGAATASFAVGVNFSTPSPWTVDVGDVNADGKPDLVLSAGGVVVLLNTTPTGGTIPTFGAYQSFSTNGGVSRALLADVNGDGKPDVVTAGEVNSSAAVAVLLNTTPAGAGTVTLAALQSFPVNHATADIAVSDLNGDGKPDFVTTGTNPNSINVLLNTTPAGSSTVTAATRQDFPAGITPQGVVIADLDGDGKPDVVVANRNTVIGADPTNNTLSFFRNETPTGATQVTFSQRQDMPAGAGEHGIVAEDMNGDGKRDVAVTDRYDGTLSVFLQGEFTVVDGVGVGNIVDNDQPQVVDNTGDADDSNYAAGQLTLREAIRFSNLGAGVITFSEALNGATITLGGTRLEVRRAVSITGPSQGVTIDGNNASQIFYFDGRTNGTFNATLQNLTITRGKTGDIEETIDGLNSGDFGGGILNDRTNLTLNNVNVSNNISSGFAGGLFNWAGANSKLTLMNSLFVNNKADTGGAISNSTDATITAVNTTFSGNSSVTSGGALFQTGGAITLTNVTATQNLADSDANGSGIGGFIHINSGLVTAHNSIFAGNLRRDIPEEINGVLFAFSSNNIFQDANSAGGLANGVNGNQRGVNPLLQPLANNGGLTRTHALGQNSPALGKGSATVAGYSPFDQRGASRDNGTPDIGAYEVNHPLAPVGVPTTLGGMFQPKPSASANEAFVKGLYQSTLLRAPDAAGLSGWLALLNGGTNRSTVANGFVNSIENRRNQVTFFYRYFLSREPDTAGLNGWVDILRSGTDEGQVMTGFILSNEFSGLNNNNQFVNLMYYALLSRQADSAGFNGWLNALNGGMSRATVVNAFLRSEEGLNRVVDGMFQTYLKRYGTSGDLSAYRTFLGSNTFGQAATLMLASTEFFTNAGNNLS
jgi:hypothetical protein